MNNAAKAGYSGAPRKPDPTILNQPLAFPNLSCLICKMGTLIPIFKKIQEQVCKMVLQCWTQMV